MTKMTSGIIDIRRATDAEADDICRMLAVQLSEHKVAIDEGALRNGVTGVLQCKEQGFFLVAVQAERIVGFSDVSFIWALEHGGRAGWLEELYVEPSLRNCGVGLKLLQAVQAECAVQGCAAIDIEIDIDHERVRSLYEKAGFTSLPRSRMVKRLAPTRIPRSLLSSRPALVPELMVTNLERSKEFYCGLAGFAVEYERPEERFLMIAQSGAWMMLEETRDFGAVSDREFIQDRAWRTGALEFPFGRGINFEIAVVDVRNIYEKMKTAQYPIKVPLEERWYRVGESQVGVSQFLVTDPDGYLLRFSSQIGEKHVENSKT